MRSARKQARVAAANFLPLAGMCSTHEPWALPKGKLALASNVMFEFALKGDKLSKQGRTRPGTTRLTNSALPNGESLLADLEVRGVQYLASDAHIYYLDGNSDPQEIGDVAAAPWLFEYRGFCLVCDGGYAKHIDPADGNAYGVLWDVAAYMVDYLSGGSDDGSWALYSGADTRAGMKVTLPTWGPGDVPQDTVRAMLSKTGSPTGNAVMKLYNADGSSLLATSDPLDVSTLGSSALQQELIAASAHGAASGETIIAVIEYDGGDASDHIKLHYDSVASDGVGITYDGSWSAVDSSKAPLMTLGAGLPPKAAVAVRKNERLMLMGGGADNSVKSRVNYSNINDPFNWGAQTYQAGAAGWFPVDSDDGGYINGALSYYENVYLSKAGNKSIHAISGKTPGEDGDLSSAPVFHHEGCMGRTMCEVGNNILFLNGAEVLALEAVPGGGFGNIRKFPKSHDISDLVAEYASSNAFAVYNRSYAQYWLQLEGLDSTLVLHLVSGDWVRYDWAGLTPTSFSHQDGVTHLGSGGHLYKLDDSVVGSDGAYGESLGNSFEAEVWGPMLDLGQPMGSKEFKQLVYQLSARLGAQAQIKFKLNMEKKESTALALSLLVPLDDDVSMSELEGLSAEDWVYPVGGGGNRLATQRLNFRARYCQVGMGLNPGGAPVYWGPIQIQYAVLGAD